MTENQTLLGFLDTQRRHVLGILDGLDEPALRRPVLPSGWSCLGLVQRLAVDDERFWFEGVVAGEQAVKDDVAAGAGCAWQVGPDVPADTVLSRYRKQIELSNELLATIDLDAAPGWWPVELFSGWPFDTVREVLLHVLTETATHAGHLDAARELIDGRTWLVVD